MGHHGYKALNESEVWLVHCNAALHTRLLASGHLETATGDKPENEQASCIVLQRHDSLARARALQVG